MISFLNVSKIIKSDKHNVLNNINLNVRKGEFVYLVGESGAGKTSLLQMIYRELKPTSGKVIVEGVDLNTMKKSKIPHLRRNIGVVFQDLKLLKKRTVFKNIAYAQEVIGVPDGEILTRVDDVLRFLDLSPQRNKCVERLSTGERQRVAVARAIINHPDVLLCDEITGNLNYEMSIRLLRLLFELNRKGTTIIFATHDREVIKDFPSRIIELRRGEIINDA